MTEARSAVIEVTARAGLGELARVHGRGRKPLLLIILRRTLAPDARQLHAPIMTDAAGNRDRSALWQASDRHAGSDVALAYPWDMAKHVTVQWNGELDFEATDDDGAKVAMSPKPGVYSPAALILAGLAGCTGMDAASIMSKKKLAVDKYSVDVHGEQREAHPRFFTSITVEHIIEGTSIDDKAVARAVELSARKYCVVGANLASGDTSINHRVRVTDENGERTCDCLTIGPRGKGLSHYESP